MTSDVRERGPAGSPSRTGHWDLRTGMALEALEHVLRTHLRQTEGPGGLFEDVLDRAPHLMHEVEGFRTQHRELLAALDRAAEAATGASSALDTVTSEDRIHRVSTSIAEHLDREDDLVWRAYDVDIGGGGQ